MIPRPSPIAGTGAAVLDRHLHDGRYTLRSMAAKLRLAVLAVAGMGLGACGGFSDVAIYHAGRDGPESTVLFLSVQSCNADHQIELDESATVVTVTIAARQDTDDDCSDAVAVLLDAPLGDRPLVDGSTGGPINVYDRPAPE